MRKAMFRVLLASLIGAAPAAAGDFHADVDPLVRLWMDDLEAAQLERAQALAKQPQARDKLAAFLLAARVRDEDTGRYPPNPIAMAWLREAAALAPEDSLIAWAQVMACAGDEVACGRDDALLRLQAIEPDNALVWMYAANAARRPTASAERARHERRMLAATGFANHYGAVARAIHAAWDTVPMPAMNQAQRAGLGAMYGFDIPEGEAAVRKLFSHGLTLGLALTPLHVVSEACLPERQPVDDPARHAACVSLYERMATDDSVVIAPMSGLRGLILLHQDDPVAQAHWREAYRRFWWHYEQAGRLHRQLSLAQVLTGNHIQRFVADGELAAMRELLREHSVPLDPPVGWLPTQPRHRLLVTEGRELD